MPAINELASNRGLKCEHMGLKSGLVKLRVTGDDEGVDHLAKEYGRHFGGLKKSLNDNQYLDVYQDKDGKWWVVDTNQRNKKIAGPYGGHYDALEKLDELESKQGKKSVNLKSIKETFLKQNKYMHDLNRKIVSLKI